MMVFIVQWNSAGSLNSETSGSPDCEVLLAYAMKTLIICFPFITELSCVMALSVMQALDLLNHIQFFNSWILIPGFSLISATTLALRPTQIWPH